MRSSRTRKKGTFTGKAFFVDEFVKKSLAPKLNTLLIAFVGIHIGNQAMIEANFTRLTRIKGAIRIEKSASDINTQVFDAFEGCLQVAFQIKGIVVVTCNDTCAGKDEAMGIADRQDVTGFGAFAMLINDTLTAFFGKGMRAIKVQVGAVEVSLDTSQTVMPNLLKTACRVPFLPMIVDCLPTDFFFSGWVRSGAIGNCDHWQPVCKRFRL